jgi:nucleotide-binding universal stress UspA family protein
MATTLLVAVDFEDPSRRAVQVARELAGPLGAELCLVHTYLLPVYTYPGFEPALPVDFSAGISAAAGRALEAFAAEVGVPRALLREGDPAPTILAAAREVSAAMIVMGTHGRRGLAKALLGSVAEKVVRTSEIPVLTVHAASGQASAG